METANNLQAGMRPEEARIAFGGGGRFREALREGRGLGWLEDEIRDVRYAFTTVPCGNGAGPFPEFVLNCLSANTPQDETDREYPVGSAYSCPSPFR